MISKDIAIKAASIVLAGALITSLTLMVLKKIPTSIFWGVAILSAIVAYGVIPKMNR